MGIAYAADRAGRREMLDGDAHRHAGGAGAAGRAVREAMAAAEPDPRQRIVKSRRAPSAELDDQLALGAPGNIGARDRGGGEKLRQRHRKAERLYAGRSRLRLRASPITARSRTARSNVHPFRSPSP